MNKEVILTEISFKAVRSSGAGGQNVNKVATKVILTFLIFKSKGLTEDEITLLQTKLQTKISQEGVFQLACDEDRSQLKNKELAIKRFFDVLKKALQKPKERKATKIPRAVKEKRLTAKKEISALKQNRKKPNI
ncbi:alternative ribosome rescue aminoacyl-tRNA hydrolase ArfB [Flavobacterium sp. 20NA77.7]|uniref:Alternative ribosome rescue aminoacyl-tRNA hydrolase ArfB n=1 Tax=Flavobacterium nakdongensis TaxID=3073563 RepID=A0ABY9RBI7_9FLAO|nr:alternative ribosome rescue aminoacyl-tRNA hydrolase ArfB [Flavobacterium sp. 20NA77.7]WMW77577.1 alternative ribosome rescue aminoacyl-tRNA hydrolase ArfB [Flavobacterium sp. 20NA77.7]